MRSITGIKAERYVREPVRDCNAKHASRTQSRGTARLTHRPNMQKAIRRLMSPDDMLETFSELAAQKPDQIRLVLLASVTALVNMQSVEAVDEEMKQRAVMGN